MKAAVSRLLMLRALAQRDQPDAALPLLDEALRLAEPEGHLRLFADEARMIVPLLHLLLAKPGFGASPSHHQSHSGSGQPAGCPGKTARPDHNSPSGNLTHCACSPQMPPPKTLRRRCRCRSARCGRTPSASTENWAFIAVLKRSIWRGNESSSEIVPIIVPI